MAKLTIGKRTYLGFISLLVIAIALGGIAIFQMKNVSQGANRLAQAYIPEVIVANSIERNLMDAMHENRGYSYTGDLEYYETGQHALSEAEAGIDASLELASVQNLKMLQADAPVIQKAVANYKSLLAQTRSAVDEMATLVHVMDKAAASFTKASEAMVDAQELGAQTELKEREQKVDAMVQALQHGDAARLFNLKAQATGDLSNFDKSR